MFQGSFGKQAVSRVSEILKDKINNVDHSSWIAFDKNGWPAFNVTTGKWIRGINRLLLSSSQVLKQVENSNGWATEKQIKAIGGIIDSDVEPQRLVYFTKYSNPKYWETNILTPLRPYYAYNIADCVDVHSSALHYPDLNSSLQSDSLLLTSLKGLARSEFNKVEGSIPISPQNSQLFEAFRLLTLELSVAFAEADIGHKSEIGLSMSEKESLSSLCVDNPKLLLRSISLASGIASRLS